MLQELVKLLKKIVLVSLLPPTTSASRYYLQADNVSFDWIPSLKLVHQIVRGLEIPTLFPLPLLMMQIKCLFTYFHCL